MSDAIEARVRAAHAAYFEALGAGDMQAVADQFTFPALFKGFLEDATIAADAPSLIATYERLIAAAPTAARTDVHGLDFGYVRPNVYMLTMRYAQFDGDDNEIHAGRAVYFLKEVEGEFKLFAVI